MTHFVLEISLIDFIFQSVLSLLNNYEPYQWTISTIIDKIVALTILTLLTREFIDTFTFYKSWAAKIDF